MCWGRNDKGQLGRGSARNFTANISAVDDTTDQITATAHGFSTGDAVSFAGTTTLPGGIDSENTIYFISKVDEDTVELRSASDSSTVIDLTSAGSAVQMNKVFPFAAPIKQNLTSDLTAVRQLALQNNATCVLLSNGTVRCVGDSSNGATGLNLETGTSDFAEIVRNSDDSGNLSDVVALSGGAQHACVLLKNKTAQCWGSNTFGQLGHGTTNHSSRPTPVSTLANAVGIASGGQSSCALVRSVENEAPPVGRVLCWGSNSSGVLANGSIATYSSNIGAAVKIDPATPFQARFKECGTIYEISDAP